MRERLIGAAAIVVVAIVLIPWLVSRARHVHQAVQTRVLPVPASMTGEENSPTRSVVLPATRGAALDTAATTMAAAVASPAPPAPGTKATSAEAPAPTTVSAETATRSTTPRESEAKANAPTGPIAPARGWGVQVGSFVKRGDADALARRLTRAGFKAIVVPHSVRGRKYLRVIVGPYPDSAAAQAAAPKVASVSGTKVLVQQFRDTGG